MNLTFILIFSLTNRRKYFFFYLQRNKTKQGRPIHTFFPHVIQTLKEKEKEKEKESEIFLPPETLLEAKKKKTKNK